jgi:sulfide:quinone oxidoreductase
MNTASKPRIVVLGAGFGGLELTTLLSEAMGDSIDVTLIDQSDSFVFGFSKLDVMFGLKTIRNAPRSSRPSWCWRRRIRAARR